MVLLPQDRRQADRFIQPGIVVDTHHGRHRHPVDGAHQPGLRRPVAKLDAGRAGGDGDPYRRRRAAPLGTGAHPQRRSGHDGQVRNDHGRGAGDLGQGPRALRGADQQPRGKSHLRPVQCRLGRFPAAHGKIMELSRGGQKTEARALLTGPSAKTMTEMNEVIKQLVKINIDGGVRAAATATATYTSARGWQIVLLVLNIAIGFALALWIARLVSRPLQEALALARQVADGDLTQHIEARSNCETGQLIQALGDMNHSLQSLVGQVRSGTDLIATASSEIAAGNQDLSSRTEEQASSLEETASSMEQLTSTVKQNADNARQANQLARSASGIAVKGGDVVGQVVARWPRSTPRRGRSSTSFQSST